VSTGGAAGSAGAAGAGAGGMTAAAGTAGAGGAAATGVKCGSIATPRTLTKHVVSDRVIDYVLDGAPSPDDHHVLLLLFNASSKGPNSPDADEQHVFYTPEELGDVYFNDPNGVFAFLNEDSFGKVSLSGRVVGWFDDTGTTPTALDFQTNVLDYVEQAAGDVTFSDYDVIYVVGLTDGTDTLQLGWGLQNSLETSQGHWDGGIDWMVNSNFFTAAGGDYYFSVILPSRSWAHELHHTLGIDGHDISLDCGNTTLAAACAFNGYGNDFSLMGESFLGNHPSIEMKQALGWLTPAQLVTPTTSDPVTICPTETLDPQPKGLLIPLDPPLVIHSTTVDADSTFDRVYVEYRAALGFDRYLDRLSDPTWLMPFITMPRTFRKDGVVITLGYADTTTQASALLDLHPDSDYNPNYGIEIPGNTGKFLDAMLYVGETFELADQHVRISPVALDGDGISVKVEKF
jgi:hypothetical protein